MVGKWACSFSLSRWSVTNHTLSAPVIFIFWSHARATISLVARLPSGENSRVNEYELGSKPSFLYFSRPALSSSTPPSPRSASVIRNGILLSAISAVG